MPGISGSTRVRETQTAQRCEMDVGTNSPSNSAAVALNEVKIETFDESDLRYSHSDIAKYLSSGLYPANADEVTKCTIRKRSKFFIVEGGHLHYVGGKVKKSPKLVVVNEDEQHRLVRTVHDLGRDKTLSKLSERYYWPDMYKQICAYVSVIIL